MYILRILKENKYTSLSRVINNLEIVANQCFLSRLGEIVILSNRCAQLITLSTVKWSYFDTFW